MVDTKVAESRSIASYAVLKSLYDSNKGYFDLLLPLAWEAIDSPSITIVTAQILERLMAETYGLRVPASICESLLKKMVKEKVVTQIDSGFTLRSKRKTAEIYKQVIDKEKKLTSFVESLRSFVKSGFDLLWTFEDAEFHLQSFLDMTSSSFFEVQDKRLQNERVKLQWPDLGTKEAFAIAAFIDQLGDVDALFVFDLYTGQIIANTILCVDLFHLKSNLNDLVLILDSPICFHLLGLNSIEKENESHEILRLAKNLQCSVRVFDHTIQEVQNVLLQTLNNWDSTREYQLRRFLNERGIDKTHLKEIHDTLRVKLQHLGIGMQRAPEASRSPIFIEADIEGALKVKVKQAFESAVEYDIKSAMYLYSLREFESPTRLEEARYIFVTSNSNVARAINDLCKDDARFKYVALVVTDSVIGNHLWLRAPVDSKFPAVQLSAACSSMIRLSDDQWHKIVANAESLRAQGTVSSDQITIIRSDPVFQEIASRTLMGSTDVERNSILPIIERYTRSVQEPVLAQLIAARSRTEEIVATKRREIQAIDDEAVKIIGRRIRAIQVIISCLIFVATAVPILQYALQCKVNVWLFGIAVLGNLLRVVDFVWFSLKPRDLKNIVPFWLERAKGRHKVRAVLLADVVRLTSEVQALQMAHGGDLSKVIQ